MPNTTTLNETVRTLDGTEWVRLATPGANWRAQVSAIETFFQAPLTSANDTNVTITLGGSPSICLLSATSITLGWTGTLAAGRLNANVVQGVTNDTNVTGSIAAQVLTLGWTGTLAAGRLNANVVQSVVNDTNVTGSIASQALTLGWTGTLAVGRGGTGVGTLTTNGVLYGNAASAVNVTAQGGANTVLTANAGAPSFSAAPTIGTSVTTPLIIGGTAAGSTLTLESTSGAGTSDSIIFDTGSQSQRLLIDTNGNVVVGTAALVTSATNGFLYKPTCAGAPTGTPTSYTGRLPSIFDTTENYLWEYDAGWLMSPFGWNNAYTSYTPTVTSSGGTVTAATITVTGYYFPGTSNTKTLFMHFNCTITNIGTGTPTGNVILSMPGSLNGTHCSILGYHANSGKMMQGISNGVTTMSFSIYDATALWVNGTQFTASGLVPIL
jgi:hypothetical protein